MIRKCIARRTCCQQGVYCAILALDHEPRPCIVMTYIEFVAITFPIFLQGRSNFGPIRRKLAQSLNASTALEIVLWLGENIFRHQTPNGKVIFTCSNNHCNVTHKLGIGIFKSLTVGPIGHRWLHSSCHASDVLNS